eukprot:TRINITY_DN3015_c0_g1_i1.p1 TRINITY_DN3015_c0_g1~~TRINITY_DN3015_c0_g1_i1.p1  ORF type:complete len:204 (+),score=34.61 TRINITY_DN3015_c0_g1_i1:120-731(+)
MQGLDEGLEAGNTTCREFLSDLLPFPKTEFTFLELGCSNGWATRYVYNQHKENLQKAIGLDISPRMVWKANHHYQNPSSISFECTDILQYRSDVQFDIVFSFALLYYIDPPEKIISKIREWLKPNGIFASGLDFYKENEVNHHWPTMMNTDMVLWSIQDWVSLFEKAGLEGVTTHILQYPQETRSPKEKGTLFIYGRLPECDK